MPRGDVNSRHYPDEKHENAKNEDIPGCGSGVVCPEGPMKYMGALKKYVVPIVHSHT